MPQLFNPFARQNTFDAFLDEKSCRIFLLLCGLLLDEAFTNLLIKFSLYPLLFERLNHKHDTVATLATTLILLNQTDSISDAKFDSERVLHNLSLGLGRLTELVHVVVHELYLLIERLRWLLLLFLAVVVLLFLLFGLLLLLFLLAARVLLNLLFKLDVYGDATIFTEVPRDRNFND